MYITIFFISFYLRKREFLSSQGSRPLTPVPTRWAMDRDEVRPGLSIPSRWMRLGQDASEVITKSGYSFRRFFVDRKGLHRRHWRYNFVELYTDTIWINPDNFTVSSDWISETAVYKSHKKFFLQRQSGFRIN